MQSATIFLLTVESGEYTRVYIYVNMYMYIPNFRIHLNVGGFFFNLEILRVPHGHDYANMIWEFDNEALESYWMLYILHSLPLPLPTRLPLFVERPHTQYLLCVIGLLIFELLRLSLWACRFVVVVRVCLTCPLCVHIVFIVIHAGLLLSLVASIFNTPQHWSWISPPSDAQFP